ncbi:30S ribosomal protein S1 [Geobacter pelophilus]|uniref:30S ribosomal protein S1 n=1 Tax=Geoanaerobacter pelophilus TaxID=60036 RepID=A0AAW4KXM8_9BACT|nr:30S ribosomal protein S1 [Geoanaerobacter pelophilus]MBT0663484.1 30S ribosomal protein S1 [Geoanaerobacter pelophilus]
MSNENDLRLEGEEDFAALLAASDSSFARFTPGQKIEATVIKVTAEWVFIDTGTKGEGVLDRKEFLKDDGSLTVSEGDVIPAWFIASRHGEMRFTTRLDGSSGGNGQLEEAFNGGIPVQGFVEKEVKGGYEVKLGGSRAFCPFSQTGLRRDEAPETFLGKHHQFRITEYRENGRSIVVSRRALLDEERQAKREAAWDTVREGEIVVGTVASLREFGAFVEIGGIEGLIPMSELGWKRVKDAAEVLTVGQQVKVLVKRVDREAGKISLSLRDTLADPWETLAGNFPEGSYVNGMVSRLANFGAFVTLADGIDGLIPISRLGSGKRINHPREVLKEGERIEVKVESLDMAARRISLSLGAASRAVEEEESELAAFRQQAVEGSTKSLGSLGELLKAKMKK